LFWTPLLRIIATGLSLVLSSNEGSAINWLYYKTQQEQLKYGIIVMNGEHLGAKSGNYGSFFLPLPTQQRG
jgi:hypothetical protein